MATKTDKEWKGREVCTKCSKYRPDKPKNEIDVGSSICDDCIAECHKRLDAWEAVTGFKGL